MRKRTRVNTRLYRMRVSRRKYILGKLHLVWMAVAPFLFTALMWFIAWCIMHQVAEAIS